MNAIRVNDFDLKEGNDGSTHVHFLDFAFLLTIKLRHHEKNGGKKRNKTPGIRKQSYRIVRDETVLRYSATFSVAGSKSQQRKQLMPHPTANIYCNL